MKRFFQDRDTLFILLVVPLTFLFCQLLLAQSPSPIPVPTPLVTDATQVLPAIQGEDVSQFLESINGLKGLGAMGIALLVVQGLLLALRSSFVNLPGKWKLVVASGLSLVTGVLALRLNGVDLTAAILHGSTLASLNVFAHQIVKQFTEKS